MKNMIADGYQDAKTLQRRIEKVEGLAGQARAAGSRQGRRIRRRHRDRPGRHHRAHPLLPQRSGRRQDAVRRGRHQDRRSLHRLVHDQHRPLPRAAAKLLGGQRDIPVKPWVAPPTKMDQSELIKEGHYAAFGTAGARTEMPGCSLCMGNQAQVREGATVIPPRPATSPTAWARTPMPRSAELGHRLQARQDPHRRRNTTRPRASSKDGQRRSPLHELRPDRGVRGSRQGRDGLIGS